MAVRNKPKPMNLPPTVGAETAPIISTDGVASIGASTGTIRIDLGADIYCNQTDGSVTRKVRIVAALRMSPGAAQSMVAGIQKGLDMHRQEVLARKQARMQQQQRKNGKPPKNSNAAAVADEEQAETAH